MKKILLAAAGALLFVSASAQVTPEAIMGMTPDLPSAASLLQYYKDYHHPDGRGVSDPNVISTFQEAWRSAHAQINEMQEKGMAPSLTQKAMASKVGGTGKTAAEVSRMSESEAKNLAMATMQGRLSSLGLSQADLNKLQGSKLSEEEQKAMASKVMAAQMGGITAKDIEAMSNMTPEQRRDFMQESGLGESVSAKMAADRSKHAANRNMTALIMEMQGLDARIKVKTDEVLGKKAAIEKEGLRIYNEKYKKRVSDAEAGMEAAIRDGALEEKPADPARSKAAYDRFVAFRNARYAALCDFYAEYIPLYRNAVAASMDCCRAELLPLMKQKQQIQEKLYAQTQDASYALTDIVPLPAAQLYFERAYDIIDFELEF